jgi:ribosomal protein L16 Arg81 hydroxylase
VFKKLISPVLIEDFLDIHWDRCPLHLVDRSPSIYESIVSLKNLDDYLTRADIRHPSLRLVKNGSELPLESYSRELRLAAHSSHDLIDLEKLFFHHQGGATIVLQLLNQSLPQLARFTNEIENELGCSVQASCFITPRQSRGFTAHYDTYSFFVLQLYGSKQWKLYRRTPLLPILEDRETDKPWTG